MTKQELIEKLAPYSPEAIVCIFGTNEELADVASVEYVPTNEEMSQIISEEMASDEAPWAVCLCAEV